MPNRMLRDWTDSDKINGVSVYAERFFTRLIMKVDDYGCFYADVRLLKANLFPLLLDAIREADMLRWMTECQKAGLIVLYESNNKKYLQIIDFKQRLDKARAKYPLPNAVNDFPERVNEFPAELEVELETEKKGSLAGKPPKNNSFKSISQKEFYDEVGTFKDKFDPVMLRSFYNYWIEEAPSGKMRFQLERTWQTSLRLVRWKTVDDEKNIKVSASRKSYDTGPSGPPLTKLQNIG